MSEGTGADPGPEPVRRPLDVLLYAPVGLVVTVLEDLPGLVAKGRRKVEQEIGNARIVGRFVVHTGQKDVGARVARLWQRDGDGTDAADAADMADRAGTGDLAGAGTDPGAPAVIRRPPVPPPAPRPAPNPADRVTVEQALAGYDTQSASQVVRRLESLTPDQLEAVHRYEASHRNRRTILNRTRQLLETTPQPAVESNGSGR